MDISHLINWIAAILGWWEISAPFVLGYPTSGTAFWNEIIIGFLLIILGVWAAVAQNNTLERVLDVVNLIIGAWLIISPFIFEYSERVGPSAMWYPIVVGAAIVILEAISITKARKPGTLSQTEGA